tara:strand:+ start:8361 stop:8603 length:243 start_codon:yes stop_codon:yes gene_type:complete
MEKPNLTTSQWIDKGFWALITGAVWLAVVLMSSMNQSISDMGKDISKLNQKLAVLVFTTNNQNESLNDHENRLRVLERKP